jgi:thiopeptide-type bacteriocin biosynthesis protein
LIQGVAGPSGASLLGRFCHGHRDLTDLVVGHLRAEEALRPDAIFAEIVHLPEGRLGNILCRPVLREHEIPYLGRGGASDEAQISVSDLVVSLEGSRVVLRSRRLGREVVPRLTSAHNYRTGLATYNFLCSLQSQGSDAVGWTWSALEHVMPHLPRVTLGRSILSLAQWNLQQSDIEVLDQRTPAARFREAQALRRRLELPRWIGVVDADNVLTVDLDNVVDVDSMVSLVRKRAHASVQETFPTAEELCAIGPEGAFTHEIVVPFVRRSTVAAPPAVAPRSGPAPSSRRLPRSFAVGSEWLYAKLYTGTATADRVLTEVVAPFVEESLEEGDADSWFFLRYSDPRWHLRVRLHGDPARLTAKAIPRLHRLTAPLLDDGRIWRVCLDTYEREIERYGGDEGMLLCEALFRADSESTLAIQQSLSGDEAADARWRLALRGMHLLLADLGLALDARLALLTDLRQSFAEEHHVNVDFQKRLGAKFRGQRLALESLLAPSVEGVAGSVFAAGLVALEERSAKQIPLGAGLAALDRAGRLSPSLPGVAANLLHMHANRLLRSEQRAQELVLYDFLARLYDSQASRRPKG